MPSYPNTTLTQLAKEATAIAVLAASILVLGLAISPVDSHAAVAHASSGSYYRGCGTYQGYQPKSGGYAIILYKLKVHRVLCRKGAQIGGGWYVGDHIPRGWNCHNRGAITVCSRGNHRLKFTFDGDAG